MTFEQAVCEMKKWGYEVYSGDELFENHEIVVTYDYGRVFFESKKDFIEWAEGIC